MNLNSFGRVGRLAAIGAILLFSASCIKVNEHLGENLIPTDQKWDVYPQEAQPLKDIRLQMADSLSGYSSTRFTFGAVKDDLMGTTIKSTSFTLVPISDSLDFGKNPKVRGFHFTASRDTLSTVYDSQLKMIQNIYVYELKQALDSTVLYSGAFDTDKYVDKSSVITEGIPVYDGGDSLSFEFSREFAESLIEKLQKTDLDSLEIYVQGDASKGIAGIPGIFITTDSPASYGGRINMFDLEIDVNKDYGITGNYAELKFRADYGDRKDVDTSFVFFFGPGDFLKNLKKNEEITQFAFNTGLHLYEANDILNGEEMARGGVVAKDKIYVEGGSGVKPVIKAAEIREIIEAQMMAAGISDIKEAVINKATIILPYNVNGDYDLLDKFPDILSPTVKLRSSEGNFVTYAGLTDASISTENQGDINRSLSMYSPDISHHVQEIMKLKKDENYDKNISKYDIWFLVMHEEVVETENNNSMNDMYQNLMYSSYYNNMMYDPYGYGYGGYGGYGYGGYGYSNYYNYAMMAAMYSNMNSGNNTQTKTELDKDRFYSAALNGPAAAGAKPQIKITFSAPKSAE